MSVTEAVRDLVDVESMELAPRNGFHLEPPCRICRNDGMRQKVNGLLATGTSYAMILRALGKDNDKLDKRDRVTVDSIRNHCVRHFPVQNAAKATYRRILERRAQENGVDFVEGVATAITPLAFFETVMVKGYATLVDSDTTVDVNTGMIAAGRLQALIESRASGTRIADLMVQMDGIINAIHSTVPQELWPEILRKIDGPVAADTDEIEDWDDGARTSTTPWNPRRQTRTAGLRLHGESAEMIVKVDRIIAAERLQSLIDSRDCSRDLLLMKVQLGQICHAVKSTVPQEMWGGDRRAAGGAGAALGGARRRGGLLR